MQDTVPAADVRELAAAIRTALDPPKAALSVERARLLEERAGYICGALAGLATDADPALWVRIAAEVIRETVNDVPVTYEVQTMLSAPLDRGRYDAASAAEVAEGVEGHDPWRNVCGESYGLKHGGRVRCTLAPGHAGGHEAGGADIAWPQDPAAHLQPPAPYGHQSLQPAKEGA